MRRLTSRTSGRLSSRCSSWGCRGRSASTLKVLSSLLLLAVEVGETHDAPVAAVGRALAGEGERLLERGAAADGAVAAAAAVLELDVEDDPAGRGRGAGGGESGMRHVLQARRRAAARHRPGGGFPVVRENDGLGAPRRPGRRRHAAALRAPRPAEPRAAESHAHGWDHYLERLAGVAAGRDPGRDPWLDGDMS